MLLTNIGLVHWHLYPLIDIGLFGEAIGVVGRNGQGKSTIIDAIQTVASGGDATIKLNKRASTESTGPRRTIRSYCLGSVSEANFLRQESSTYLLLGFADPLGKRPPVTLMVAFSAKDTESKHTLVTRAIINGVLLRAEDIQTVKPDGSAVVETWEVIRQRIIGLVESRKGKLVEYRSSHKEFVREYMYVLFHKNRSHAQEQFQKNFINSIAFDTQSSANSFIQNSLLVQNDIDIHSLREQWKRFHNLYELTQKTKQQIGELEKLTDSTSAYIKAKFAVSVEEMISVTSKAEHARQENKRLKQILREETKKRDENAASAKRLKTEIDNLQKEIISVTGQKEGAQNADRRARLKADINLTGGAIQKALSPFVGQDGIVRTAVKLHKAIDRQTFADTPILVALDNLVAETGNDPLATKMPEDLAAFARCLGDLSNALEEYTTSIDEQVQNQAALIAGLTKEKATLAETIKSLQQNTLVLEADTSGFIKLLNGSGIETRVFSEAVEVCDETWRGAAEGYLGKYREAIFVDIKDNEEARRLLKENRRKFPQALLANVRKMSERKAVIEHGTLASVLSTDDPIISAFVEFRTGRVKLAVDASDFAKPGNWITAEGLYDDGSVTSIVTARSQKIGKGGIEQQLAASEKRKPQLDEEILRAQRTGAALASGQKSANRLGELFLSIGDIDASIDQLRVDVEEGRDKLLSAQKELEVIESQDTSSYDEELVSLENEKREIDAERDKLIAAGSKSDAQIEETNRKLNGGELTQGSTASLISSRSRLKETLKGHPEDILHEMRLAYIGRRRAKRPGELHHASSNALSDLKLDAAETANEVKAIALRTIELLEDGALFEDGIDIELNVIPWAKESLERLRDVTLVDHEDALKRATESAMDMFKTGYINELHARFQIMEGEIKAYNSILKNYPFLDEIYTIKATRAVAFEPFHEVVEKMREMELATTGGGLLMGAIDDPKAILEAMESVKHMLFNEESNLDDFIDYRKYWTFDIEINHPITKVKNSFSNRKATGSGGEQQTPYYMLMMCALSNSYYGGAFRPNRPGESGMCLAIFDEAFNNMDGRVAGMIFDFGKKLGLQALYCGPSDKKQLMQEHCGTVLSVFKSADGKQTMIVEEKVSDELKEELQKIDPSRMTDDQVSSLTVGLLDV